MANTNDANDAARIAENLKRFGWSPIGFADFAAWVALQFGQTEPEELESDNNSTVHEV